MLAMGGDVPGVVAVGPSATGIFAFGQDAHGVFAFGQRATGFVAVGQVATGVISIGQISRGCVAIGQGALGLVAVGQVAVGVLWAGGLGVGGTAGPGLVFGFFGRLRVRDVGGRFYEFRKRIRRLSSKMRGIPQDAVPLYALDRKPWTPGRIALYGLRVLGAVGSAVLWWFLAGQALVDNVF